MFFPPLIRQRDPIGSSIVVQQRCVNERKRDAPTRCPCGPAVLDERRLHEAFCTIAMAEEADTRVPHPPFEQVDGRLKVMRLISCSLVAALLLGGALPSAAS